MAAIPYKMFTHKRIQKMLEAYRDDTSVFATETEYYLALYANEMWQRLNLLKEWTERYRLNTESIEAFMKRETAKPKKTEWIGPRSRSLCTSVSWPCTIANLADAKSWI